MRRWTALVWAAAMVMTGTTAMANPGDRDGPLVIAPDCDASYVDDPFYQHGLRLEDDLLVIDVSYSGGCRPHEFFVCWDGVFAESHPPQAQLLVFHDSHGDSCEALIRAPLYVDLSSLRVAYRRDYNEDGGTFIITAGAQCVEYSFGCGAWRARQK